MNSQIDITQPNEDGYDFGSLVLAIKHQFLLLAFTIVTFVAVAVVYVETRTPLYQAQSLVLLSQSRTALDAERDPLQNSAQIEALVFGEMRYLSSDNFLLDLIRQADLANEAEFQSDDFTKPTTQAELKEAEVRILPALRERMSLKHEGDSYVLSITFRSESASFAKDLANEAAAFFVSRSQQRGSQGVLDLASRVAGQLRNHSDKVIKAEANLDQLLLPILNSDAADPNLRNQYQALLIESSSLIPLEARRLDEATRTIGPNGLSSGQLSSLGSIERRRLDIFDAKRKIWDELALLDTTNAMRTPQVFESFQTLDLTHQVYSRLLGRLLDLELEANLFVPGASLLAPALLPGGPSFPKKKNTVILALILSVAFGLALVIWREFFRGRLLKSSQLPATIPQHHRFFLSLSRRKIRTALERPKDKYLQQAMFDVDRLIAAMEPVYEHANYFGRVTNVICAGKCTALVDVVQVLTHRLAAADHSVAVIDLRGGKSPSESWIRRYFRLLRQKFGTQPSVELAKTTDPLTGAHLYSLHKGVLDQNTWPVEAMLDKLIPQLADHFDDVLLLSPFVGTHGSNRPFAVQADAHIVVSELQVTKIKPLKDTSAWLLAQNPNAPPFSLTIGRS